MAQLAVDNVKKCECKEYYILEIFDNKCSHCFHKDNPSKYLEIMKIEPIKFHTDSFLQNYTYKYRINDKSQIYESLETIISTDYNFNIQVLLNLTNYIKTNTIFKGISCTQAVKLYNKFCNFHTDKIKFQHILSGLVIDWWNLNKYIGTLGGIICYYDNDTNVGKKIKLLEYGKEIKPCPALSDDLDLQALWIKSIMAKK